MDVPAGNWMVVRIMDGAKPQPPQKVITGWFLNWVAKDKSQAREVIDQGMTEALSEKTFLRKVRESLPGGTSAVRR